MAVDALLVLLFTAVGRATHSGEVLTGLEQTAWPFLVALGLGWVVARVWRAPMASLRTGVPIWLVTVVVGMTLRPIVGQGVEFGFVVVTTFLLFVLLVGWRAAWAGAMRLRARRSAASAER